MEIKEEQQLTELKKLVKKAKIWSDEFAKKPVGNESDIFTYDNPYLILHQELRKMYLESKAKLSCLGG